MFNVGVIGLGAGQGHLRGYGALPEVKILAIADLDEKRLCAGQEQYAVPHTYTDYHDLLAMAEIDAVSVCLPNYLHAPVAIEALQAGKHVLVEKPMATSAAEAAAMIAAAKAQQRTVAVSMNYRWVFAPHTFYLKHCIAQGKLGKIYYVRAVSLRRRTFVRGHKTWFSQKNLSSGGGLVDMGPHILDLAMWLTGDFAPTQVSGITRTAIMVDTDVDDLAAAMIQLKGGATIALESTWESHTRPALNITLLGTRGGAILDMTAPQNQRLTLFGQDGNSDGESDTLTEIVPVDIRLPAPLEATVQEHFVNSIRAGHQPDNAGECGLAVMKVLDGVHHSSASGANVIFIE